MKIIKGAISMDDFERDLQQQLKNPGFKAEYDSLKPEYEIIQSIIDARKARNMTQLVITSYSIHYTKLYEVTE